MALVYHIGPLELSSTGPQLIREGMMESNTLPVLCVACEDPRPNRPAAAGGNGVVDKTVAGIRGQTGLAESYEEVQRQPRQSIAQPSTISTNHEAQYERVTYYPLPGSTNAYARIAHGFEELDPIIIIPSSPNSIDMSEDLFEEEREDRAVTLERSQSPGIGPQLPVLDRNASSIRAHQTSSAETWIMVDRDPIESDEVEPTSQQNLSDTQPRPRTAVPRSVRRPTTGLAPRPRTMTYSTIPAISRHGDNSHPLMALVPPFMQSA